MLVVTAGAVAAPAPARLIPSPVSLQQAEGAPFVFSRDVVVVGEKALAPITRHTAATLGTMIGRQLSVVEQSPAGPRIQLVLQHGNSPTTIGAYRLRVQPTEIRAEADTAEGLFHAAQTLQQLATLSPETKQWTVPLVTVVDEPRFRWRGLLVDVAAHFWSKELLKQVIDSLAFYKMNVLHLHLTDYGGWRIEVPAYPRLATIGGQGNLETPGVGESRYYTRAEVREIVDYAAERFVTIVPEIEMPGHAGAAARAYPEFFDGEGTFNPAAPGVYDFIAAIVAEVARQFPGPNLHFGGDEVSTERWTQLPQVAPFMQAEGLKNSAELQRYFYGRVAKIIAAAGRRPMAWDETAEAGVEPGVLIQWWRKARPDVRDAVLAKGGELVLSPVDQVYLDYAPGPGEPGAPWEGNDNGPTSVEKILRWEPVPASLSAAQAGKILGVEAALWTQFMRTEGFLQFMLYPRVLAVAEVAWSPRGTRDPAEFQQRLAPHIERLRAHGIQVRTHSGDATPYLIH